MRVLVAAASEHGSTEEIARAIGRELGRHGIATDTLVPEAVHDLADYDAVVLGSAVYGGHWLKPARDLVDRLAGELQERRVWLFSSGPVGEPEPKPDGDPADVEDLLAATAAADHVVFAGRIKRDELGFAERANARSPKICPTVGAHFFHSSDAGRRRRATGAGVACRAPFQRKAPTACP